MNFAEQENKNLTWGDSAQGLSSQTPTTQDHAAKRTKLRLGAPKFNLPPQSNEIRIPEISDAPVIKPSKKKNNNKKKKGPKDATLASQLENVWSKPIKSSFQKKGKERQTVMHHHYHYILHPTYKRITKKQSRAHRSNRLTPISKSDITYLYI